MIKPLKELSLTDAFWCHANTPCFGFWGESRQKVRENSTLEQGVAIQLEHFNMRRRYGDGRIPFSHDVGHLILETASIYRPELDFMRPRINADTGFPEACGYNGFTISENFARIIV